MKKGVINQGVMNQVTAFAFSRHRYGLNNRSVFRLKSQPGHRSD